MEAWAAYIRAETLTTDLVSGQPPEGAYQETQKVDGARPDAGRQAERVIGESLICS